MQLLDGKIYKISVDGLTYYGSTIQSLKQRFSLHKSQYKRWKSGIKYESKCASFDIFDKYGIDKLTIELVEEYPCETKKDLLIREQYYHDNMVCINVKRAYSSDDIKAETARRCKENCIIKAKELIYCECGKTIQKSSLQGHILSKRHREYIKEYS